MGKRPNRLPATLEETKAENAVFLIRTGSANTIMAQGTSPKDAEYMTAFVPFAQKSLDSMGGSIHDSSTREGLVSNFKQ